MDVLKEDPTDVAREVEWVTRDTLDDTRIEAECQLTLIAADNRRQE